jgi:glycosyltransferase involved in cell wall biosynthesis
MLKSAGMVTVAIPVRNGARYLPEVLAAVRAQEMERPFELLVVDSGSSDRSVDIARSSGATVVEIPPCAFSHGPTRNMIMELATGDYVAFLSQDATPAHDRWLANLLAGFKLSSNVALVFGPYQARRGASATVKRELRDYFDSFAPDGEPAVQSLSGTLPATNQTALPGPLTFFTDANGCIARSAWERVPYGDVPYAEDHLLACEMLEAGFAKVFHPNAPVYHSHEYSSLDLLRRCFDEWRGLREVYGYREPLSPRRHLHRIRRESRLDRVFMRGEGASGRAVVVGSVESVRHHVIRSIGSVMGGRADVLPRWVRSVLSLERRSTFVPAPRPSMKRVTDTLT